VLATHIAADLGAALASALAVVFPVPCAGCGEEGPSLCRACAVALTPRLSTLPLAGVGTVTAGLEYSGVARACLLAYKEQGRSALAGALAAPFALAVTRALAVTTAPAVPADAVVAVPSSRAARRRRGYEPVRLLAARAGIRLTPLFRPARPRGAQKTLAVAERVRNADGAFALARSASGMRVLLVDDVVTTGSTLSAAAEVVHRGGGVVVGAAVLAATRRRDGRSSGTLSWNP